MELTGLPGFRTLGSRMAGVAYVEGWGLYCERLADEMGLYQADPERLGMLDAQSFRAARLVVDSGLHAMGWTRDRAIEFMNERGSLPLVDAEIEVDRYTIWPGQALAYKIGQREIERARREVTERMGDRFDLRAFHDEVLGHGSLPLATLRREIPGWVEAAVARTLRCVDPSRSSSRVDHVRLEPLGERRRDDLVAAAARTRSVALHADHSRPTAGRRGSGMRCGRGAGNVCRLGDGRPRSGRAVGSSSLRGHRARARARRDRVDLDRPLAPADGAQHRGQAPAAPPMRSRSSARPASR